MPTRTAPSASAVIVGAAIAAIAAGCSRPLPPPAPVPHVAAGPPARDVSPLVPLGYVGDHACYCNTVVKPDGDLDYALRVRVSGDVRALVLYASDATGAVHGMEVWDTIVAPERFPDSWHMPVPAKDTYAIGVVDSRKNLLNPGVVLGNRTFDNEELTLFVADHDHARFGSGRTYTLLVVRNDGTTDRTTTTVL